MAVFYQDRFKSVPELYSSLYNAQIPGPAAGYAPARASGQESTLKGMFTSVFKKHFAGTGAGPAQPYAMLPPLSLRCLAGMYSGNVFPSPHGRLVIGRDSRLANIVYPPDMRDISSVHCEVRLENGMYLLIDRNSTNGTFLADGTRLMPEQPYQINRRSEFYLATRENMFEIE
jgi:hypothetical protein